MLGMLQRLKLDENQWVILIYNLPLKSSCLSTQVCENFQNQRISGFWLLKTLGFGLLKNFKESSGLVKNRPIFFGFLSPTVNRSKPRSLIFLRTPSQGLSIYMPSPYPPAPSLKKRESPNNGHHQMSFGTKCHLVVTKKNPMQKMCQSHQISRKFFSATGDL